MTPDCSQVQSIDAELDSLVELAEMADEDAKDDPEGAEEIMLECTNAVLIVKATAERLELDTVFSEDDDKMNCFAEISAGSGGKESQDFAQMLMTMYLKWGEASGHKYV
jgi:peptide chain release factor 2